MSLTRLYADQVLYGALWEMSCEYGRPNFEAAINNILATQTLDTIYSKATKEELLKKYEEIDVFYEVLNA